MTETKKPRATRDGAVEIEDTGLDGAAGGAMGVPAGAGRGSDQGGETPPITAMPTIGPATPPKYGPA